MNVLYHCPVRLHASSLDSGAVSVRQCAQQKTDCISVHSTALLLVCGSMLRDQLLLAI